MSDALAEAAVFTPRYGGDGLIPAVVVDQGDGAVLMVAHMNAEALAATQATGEVHFWSRSRRSLWRKGETSGQILKLAEIRTDCDQDVLLVIARVEGSGAACHTGRRSCFYRRVEGEALAMI